MSRKLRTRPAALFWLAASMGWMYGLLLLVPRLFDGLSVKDLSLLESLFAAIGLAAVMLASLIAYAFVAVWLQERFRVAMSDQPDDSELGRG